VDWLRTGPQACLDPPQVETCGAFSNQAQKPNAE